MTLSNLVSFLDHKKLIEANKIKDDDDSGFSNRLRIQKYVFIARYFGLRLPYDFNMHLHGPYSKNLTHDYYQLSDLNNSDGSLASFEKEKFLSLVQGKSDGWLEIAATILHKKGTVDDDILLDHVAWIKCDFTGEEIENVYSDLQCSILQ